MWTRVDSNDTGVRQIVQVTSEALPVTQRQVYCKRKKTCNTANREKKLGPAAYALPSAAYAKSRQSARRVEVRQSFSWVLTVHSEKSVGRTPAIRNHITAPDGFNHNFHRQTQVASNTRANYDNAHTDHTYASS